MHWWGEGEIYVCCWKIPPVNHVNNIQANQQRKIKRKLLQLHLFPVATHIRPVCRFVSVCVCMCAEEWQWQEEAALPGFSGFARSMATLSSSLLLFHVCLLCVYVCVCMWASGSGTSFCSMVQCCRLATIYLRAVWP